MAIRKELIDELLATSEVPLIGPNGLCKELTTALVERMLAGEMNHHLGYQKHEVAGYGSGNSRNGKSQKTVKGEAGEMTIEVPRDRNGTFEPQLIQKHQTRFEGFDSKILSMYALGMTVRDIQGHLHDMYGVDVSAGLISEVTDRIMEEVKAWQDRPLEALYPIIYLDALMVRMRQDGKVDNRAVYTAIGINLEGQKTVLGLWVGGVEGSKYWMSILMNLKNRGMKDALIICTDGLKGFPEAIEAVFPHALIQTCIVHLIRASLAFVNWKERKSMAADLKSIYRAPTAEMAELALADFRIKYPRHQVVADVWSRNWQRVIPFFEFPEEIRKIIYTTNAVESLNMSLRKVTKNRGSFPSQEAALKLLYLALQNVSKKWQTVQGWREALRHFTMRWPERIEQARAA
ncbi:MAG TPA: IS256 family transposase [Bryobacteraceae bacterium]|nr:IS256 family transposase [Bryobacteraceae bacterium]